MAHEVNPSVEPQSLLVVEDDETLRMRLVRAFAARGFAVESVGTVAEAERFAAAEAPEFAIVDLRIQDRSGLDVVRALLAADPATRVVVLTGYGSIATAVEALRLGAVHYLTKPSDADAIHAALRGSAAASGKVDTTTPTLARTEWEHINRVLVDSGGNVSEAARRLGLHRRSLQRKLGKYPPPR